MAAGRDKPNRRRQVTGTAASTALPQGASAAKPGTLNGDRRRLRDWLTCAGLFLLTLALYFPNTGNEFSSVDDNEYVQDSPMVLRGLTLEGIRWAFTSQHFFNWLPVTTLSHMLDVELYGLDPFGHHLTSIMLHAVNGALAYLMMLSLTARRWPSLCVALLFAVHPLRVESVAWLAERKDLLAGTFFLLTVIGYAAYARRPRHWKYVLTLILLALGLMSKTMLVTVPFLLLLLDWWPLNRLILRRAALDTGIGAEPRTLRWLISEKLPMLALVAGAAAWTMALQKYGGATELTQELTAGQRLGNAVVSVWRYVAKLLAPANLSPFYPHPRDWPVVAVAGAAALFLGLSAAVVFWGRRRPYLLVGWCWFLGMLFPVSGVLVHAGRQSIADRYMYLPGFGLLIAIVWTVASVVRSRGARWAAAGACVSSAILLAGLTARYQHVWQNDILLYDHALKIDSKNWFAAQVLGRQLNAAGRPDLAVYYYGKSLEIEPGNDRLRLERATLLLTLLPSRPEEAASDFRHLTGAAPDQLPVWIGLARAEVMAGRFSAADVAFAEAERRWPQDPDLQAQWAVALLRQGRLTEARSRANKALQADPTNEVARRALAGVNEAEANRR